MMAQQVIPGFYPLIAADPPWQFDDDCPGEGRGAAKHYSTMPTEEICALGPSLPAAPDSVLLLWQVAAMREDALQVVKAWGFTPKAEIVWIKGRVRDGRLVPQIGMGHYVRNAHETCIVATQGRPRVLRRDVPSVIVAPRTRHSEKPAAFYDLAEGLFAGPRLEMFARLRRPQWETIGNAIDGRDIRSALGAA